MSDYLMPNYARLPVSFERGKGALLWDQNGNEYLDALSGVAVCNLGHAHPSVSMAICEQSQSLVHCSNIYQIPKQQALAKALCQISGMDKAFFCNSGAEANEAAIKLARLYGHSKGIDNPLIIVTEGSFHGRTMATLTATGNRAVQAGFEPLVKGFIRVPYGDLEALEHITSHTADIVAILVEPVLGEGGIQVPPANYLDGIRKICDQNQYLMILDEIQTGMGRTGKMFAFQHSNIVPDVMTLAKGLGNGLPIGSCLAMENTAALFQPGKHGSTFGGNPLVCSAALAVLETLDNEALTENACQLGSDMLNQFRQQLATVDGVVEIRGFGLMIGIELDRPCKSLVQAALQQHLLINVTAERVVRLLPPLIIAKQQADQIVATVCTIIEAFLQD